MITYLYRKFILQKLYLVLISEIGLLSSWELQMMETESDLSHLKEIEDVYYGIHSVRG